MGRLAQLVEQVTLNHRVRGSSPRSPSNIFKGLARNGWPLDFVKWPISDPAV